MNKILVFAEQRNGELKKSSFEMVSVAQNLATSAGIEYITVLIGQNLSGLENELAQYGASNISKYSSDNLVLYNSEGFADILAEAAKEFGADVILLAATAMGKDLAPRITAKLDAAVASDCTSLSWEDGDLRITRPMYAGKVQTIVKLHSDIKIVTVRPNVFSAEKNETTASVSQKNVDTKEFGAVVQEIIKGAEQKLDVTEADVVVSGGRGLKGPENFHLIEDLAKKLGAAQGASRAVVDAGWRPYDEQVGQTGKTVSPSLYIAVAISGAIQHLAGMSSSKYIVAINKDPEAPIFKIADYGIVGDAFEVVPKMIEAL